MQFGGAAAHGLPEVRALYGPKSDGRGIAKGKDPWARSPFCFPDKAPKPWAWGGAGRIAAGRARLYDCAGDVLGYDLAKLCFEGPAEELDSTVHSQPALFVTSLAALELLREQSPDIVLACEAAAGLSLGEYTAMVFAGIMGFEEGLMTVQRRAGDAGSGRRHRGRHGDDNRPGTGSGSRPSASRRGRMKS